jgi:hypothetical protein
MPYAKLPARLRQMIPAEHGQELFRSVFNSQMQSGKPESVAFASAWGALQSAGYKKQVGGKWIRKSSGAKPLYMKRRVLNAERIVEWAKSQGITTTLDPDDIHVTVIYSKEPFSADYTRNAMSQGEAPMHYGGHVVRGGKRSVERLGKDGEALVLKIECPRLAAEHYGFRAMGASSDWADYKPHITLSWQAEGIDEKAIEPFDGDIVFSDIFVSLLDEDWKSNVTEKSSPTVSSVHVPSTELDKEDAYRAPAAARAAAQRALRWKEKYGDEVKGGTQVGWTRANQLASNENLSRETVARMAQFARHRKNSSVDPKFKDTPWRDRGHVAWLIWGGTAGVDWAKNIMDGLRKRQADDDTFTMPDEARTRSMMLGLGGEIHVSGDKGTQAFYMPGKTHDDYINALKQIANIESEDDDDDEEAHPVNGGLIDRAIYAIIGAVMQHTDVNKSFEETKVLKVDDEQRIVYGWASVVTEDGAPVVDSQGDVIEPIEMEKMANDFMLDVRTAKAMHAGDKIGEVIHSLPLTDALTKALGLQSDMEGWIVGVKIHSDEVWESVKSGEFAGFSIGGKAASREEMS